ncbi:hypothetical protein HK405_011010 [Cladochytrium tenue]|nr:hypothetical protein HK405_011010 [Cladochytrium tenue]
MDRAALESAFDVGMVGLQVAASTQAYRDPTSGQEVRRIAVGERIFELNGRRSSQSELEAEDSVVGQLFDVFANGTVIRQKACPMAVGNFVFGTKKTCLSALRAAASRFLAAITSMPSQALAAVAVSGACVVAVLTAIGVALSIARARAEAAAEDAEFQAAVAVVLGVDGEKKKDDGMQPVDLVAVDTEDGLPAYEPGYARVPTSEEGSKA